LLTARRAFAPAKVNLFLHVGPVGADGYHPVCSLMAFADIGDEVRLDPAPAMAFVMTGPFADALADGDNLVTRARDLFLDGRPDAPPFRLTLDKRLPIASGLGGGSADAAATLTLLGEAFGAELGELAELARRLGSDIAACLGSRTVIGEGRGDALVRAPELPPLPAVLVNPSAACATPSVYRAFDSGPPTPGANRPEAPVNLHSASDVARFLAGTRNDLEAPATALVPAIGETLERLRAAPETLIARMSGSGATVFALCADNEAAAALAGRLSTERPAWWVRACRLG